MKKISKGSFGYISFQRKIEIVKTIFMLALCVGVYYLGIYSTGSNKNLLTFVAILGVLPMAKYAVNVVLFSKAKGCSKELYNKLMDNHIKADYYDLFMTAYKSSFQFSCGIYGKDCLIFLTEDNSLDENEAKNHVEQVLKNAAINNVTVKIFKDSEKFIDRALQIQKESSETVPESLNDNILNVSI